ncbi:tetratricopeptide repeat protein [Candidatus Marithioploca araucensis]|uniref:Tetratricopeptide repeat protein n=1 Tax=Candidatus Marithioploca araucensis TaxID=70273 RepID=A0ABT7VSM8_9GAMM|nr:tetratricopeptide repeat protein [Candidatus Marithioploca araucensis]
MNQINMSRISTNNIPNLSEADEEELCLAHDLFLLKRPLTEEEEKVLFDPAQVQIPTLAQVKKRLKKYKSPFSQLPKMLTNISLTPSDTHEQTLKTLNRVDELHSKAKELADLAFRAEMEEQTDKIKPLYQQAFDYEEKALMLSVQTHESDIELTPLVLSKNAANLALDAQAYDKAEKMIEFGLSNEPPIEMTEELLGLLDYLAGIYDEDGEYQKAQILLEKTLAIREKIFDDEHPDVINGLNNLGVIHQKQAKQLFERALIVLNKTRYNAHSLVKIIHNNLNHFDKPEPRLYGR